MLHQIIDEKCCHSGLKGKTKDQALQALAALAYRSKLTADIPEDTIYNKLAEREEQGSTGFGDGVAIPHARIEGLKEFLVYIALYPRGIEFDSIDHKKVKLFVVILGPPEAVNEHLKILATISQTLMAPGIKNELFRSPTGTALYEAFLRRSSFHEKDKSQKRRMKLIYVILFIEEFLYHIMELFLKEGIDGATILDSSGMGEYISSVPLFADFIGFMRENKNRSKTIMAIVPEDKMDTIIEGIEDITGDLDKKQGAMVIATDISFYKGSMKMI